MSQNQEWTCEKLMACLERIVHPDFLSSVRKEDFACDHLRRLEEKEIIFCLDLIYKKSHKKLKIYGTPLEMMENLKKIDRIPQFIVYPSNEEVEFSCLCALLTPYYEYTELDGETAYSSRSSTAIHIFQSFSLFIGFGIQPIAGVFLQAWLTAYLNKTLRRLKGSYDIIPCSSPNMLIEELILLFKTEPKLKIPEKTITIDWFSDLKKYFEPEEQQFLLQNIIRMKPETIAVHQDYYKKGYVDSIFLIENTKKIFDRHIDLFTPWKKLTLHQKPAVRVLVTQVYTFLLAQELNISIRQLIQNRAPDSQFTEDLFAVESEEERKNGIVYAIKPSTFKEIATNAGFTYEDFAVLHILCEMDYRYMPLPIISSYGTHCLPAEEAFASIIYHLAVILNVFQKSNPSNLQIIFKWIDNMMDSLFVEKNVFYLIDIWKIDEIIEKARKELCPLLTEPEYEVPFKQEYDKVESIRELTKLTENFQMDKEWFKNCVEYTMSWMTRGPIYFKTIYYAYSQIIIYHLRNCSPKVERFIARQRDHEEQIQVKEHDDLKSEESSSAVLKIFNQEPSSSENRAQHIREDEDQFDLEKFNQSQLGLKSQLNRSEKQIQEAREDYKETESALNKAEKEREELQQRLNILKYELKIRRAGQARYKKFEEKVEKHKKPFEIVPVDSKWARSHGLCSCCPESWKLKKANVLSKKDYMNDYVENFEFEKVTVDSNEQVQKFLEELEKSERAKTQLAENLKTLELSHLEEDQETTESDEDEYDSDEQVQKMLEKTEGANTQLDENLETLELSQLEEDQEESESADEKELELETVVVGADEQVQKILEKSEEANTQLADNLKSLELNQLEEDQEESESDDEEELELEKVTVDSDEQVQEITEGANNQLDENLETLELNHPDENQEESESDDEEELELEKVTVYSDEQVQEILEKSEEANTQLAENLESLELNQLEENQEGKESDDEKELEFAKVVVGSDEQVQKMLEKSQETNIQLTLYPKILELSHLEEDRNLETVQEKTYSALFSLGEDLQIKVVEYFQLEIKAGRLIKERDDLRQRVKIMKSENELLKATDFKYTKFQQNVDKYRKTLKDIPVDNEESGLHGLCSRCPESWKLKKANRFGMKIDVDGSDKQVQKAREDSEKSEEANIRLPESVKTLEPSHLEEDQDTTESDEEENEELEFEKVTVDSDDKFKKLEKQSEDLMQKMEFLLSESEKLRAKVLKFAESKRKIKEQIEALKNQSRFHRLGARFLKCGTLKEAESW